MARLDETDMKILTAIYDDASISVPQLSKELGVNLSVTYSRIKRLQKRGIIQRFTVQVNEDLLGMKARAVAGLNIDPKQRETVLAEIEKVDGVRIIREVTGRFDLLVNMKGKSLDELHRTVYEIIGKIPGVMHAELFMEVSRRITRVTFKLVD
ncbi:MAG TPA: Lrp/AsnC family transcriptional regulator [Nitrososphaerales archaeon]|nr:Lrp/AsnC family transcriptional regulator [Nitrososphaerales archaeon]